MTRSIPPKIYSKAFSFVCCFLLMFCWPLFSVAEGVHPFRSENSGEESSITLSGEWLFRLDNIRPDGSSSDMGRAYAKAEQLTQVHQRDRQGYGLELNYHKADFDDSGWDKIQVPGDWGAQGFRRQGGPTYYGPAWYRQRVFVPEEWRGMPLHLQLGQPNQRGAAYWNGTEIARIKRWGPHFNILIDPEQIQYGAENVIAVQVSNHYQQGGLLTGSFRLSKDLAAFVDLGYSHVPDPKRWEREMAAIEARYTKDSPSPNPIAFIGSSTFWFWRNTLAEDLAPLPVVNLGFGGSNMNDALHYVDRIVIPFQPRAVVVYSGENDISAMGITPNLVILKTRAFIAKIHEALPETTIYFISAKPSRTRWQLWPNVFAEFNSKLEMLCAEDERLLYIDTASAMLDEEGNLNGELYDEKDGLHMNAKGYALWTDILKPLLMEREL